MKLFETCLLAISRLFVVKEVNKLYKLLTTPYNEILHKELPDDETSLTMMSSLLSVPAPSLE